MLWMNESPRRRRWIGRSLRSPWLPGRAETMIHDYKWHGTTSLFAASNVLTGKVIGSCMDQHRHVEFLKFLRIIDSQAPGGPAVHLILDNYATHKHATFKAWLVRHPGSTCTSSQPVPPG